MSVSTLPNTYNSISSTAANVSAIKSTLGVAQSKIYQGLQPMHRSRSFNNGQSVANDPGGTSRVMHVVPFNMHDLCLEIANSVNNGSGEVLTGIGPVTASYAIETPTGAIYPVSLPNTPTTFINGEAYYTVAPQTLMLSCPVGIDAAAGTNFWVRCTVRIALPPTQATPTTTTTGGTITASTHTVAITAVCGNQGESGVSSQTIATTGSTSTITATWAAPSALSVPVTAYNVYLDGLLYATVPSSVLTLTLTATATGTQTPPATGQKYPLGPYVGPNSQDTGTGANYPSVFGGTGADITLSSGTTGLVTNLNGLVFSALGIWGTPDVGYNVPQLCIRGDSIADGVDNGSAALEQPDRGFIARAIIAASATRPITYTQNGRNGETLTAAGSGHSPLRMLRASAATDMCIEYLTNDYMNTNITTAQMQALILADAVSCAKRCSRIWGITLSPRTSSTDSWATTTNQYVSAVATTAATNASPIVVSTISNHGLVSGQQVRIANVGGNTAANGTFYVSIINSAQIGLYSDPSLASQYAVAGNGTYTTAGFVERTNIEANKNNYNAWIRAGAPITITSGLPNAAAIGTAGAITCAVYGPNGALVQAASSSSSPFNSNGVLVGHPFSGGVFDSAATVEFATAQGVVWIANGTARYYCDSLGTHFSTNGTALAMQAVPVQMMVAA